MVKKDTFKKGFLGLSIILAFSSHNAFAGNTAGNFETTASITSTCSISATDVNFGVVSSPLTKQGATGELSVLCTNKSSYQIDLSYASASFTGVKYSSTITNTNGNLSTDTQVFDPNNKIIGTITCYTSNSLYHAYVDFSTLELASLYGYSKYGTNLDSLGACSAGTATQPKSGASSYGAMTGISKGNLIGYAISVPGDLSKVWKQGVNSYSNSGTGATQTFIMNASILPDNSSSKYPAQDSYIDTVTAIISY